MWYYLHNLAASISCSFSLSTLLWLRPLHHFYIFYNHGRFIFCIYFINSIRRGIKLEQGSMFLLSSSKRTRALNQIRRILPLAISYILITNFIVILAFIFSGFFFSLRSLLICDLPIFKLNNWNACTVTGEESNRYYTSQYIWNL